VGESFNRLEIAADAVNAEVLINLPKLKTHSQMLLTLGVKNLFGCIVGFRKPEWHLRAGVDRKRFAQLLVEIYRCLQPPLNILDGILAMEGDGPGLSGTPRELGVLIGSDDALALDTAVCKMLGLNPERLLTLLVAREMDLGGAATEMQGALPEVRDFKLPEITPLVFGPRPLHGVLRRHLVQRPVCEAPRCKICGECVKYCPVKAISRQRKGVAFDYDQCIRCYCCVEVCPHGALRAEEPRLGRWLRKLMQYRLAAV
jgi:ferredoxin